MRSSSTLFWYFVFVCAISFTNCLSAEQFKTPVDATQRISAAIRYWRDKQSFTEASLIVHREDFERTSTMRVWTRGMSQSLVRFVAPAKDAGNASLKNDSNMWSYSPKINRVVKIPPSMMTQSWMGSDFSYNDLAKADEIVHQYSHRLISSETQEGHRIDIIEAIPHENSPVVWGREVLKIRDDDIILEHEFYDQDMKLIKRLRVKEIRLIGGKLFPTWIRMENLEQSDKWTEIKYSRADFSRDIPEYVFTLSNLRNPRELN